jgi:hypothetical protein
MSARDHEPADCPHRRDVSALSSKQPIWRHGCGPVPVPVADPHQHAVREWMATEAEYAKVCAERDLKEEALRAAALCLVGQRDCVADELRMPRDTSMDDLLNEIRTLRESRFRRPPMASDDRYALAQFLFEIRAELRSAGEQDHFLRVADRLISAGGVHGPVEQPSREALADVVEFSAVFAMMADSIARRTIANAAADALLAHYDIRERVPQAEPQ